MWRLFLPSYSGHPESNYYNICACSRATKNQPGIGHRARAGLHIKTRVGARFPYICIRGYVIKMIQSRALQSQVQKYNPKAVLTEGRPSPPLTGESRSSDTKERLPPPGVAFPSVSLVNLSCCGAGMATCVYITAGWVGL